MFKLLLFCVWEYIQFLLSQNTQEQHYCFGMLVTEHKFVTSYFFENIFTLLTGNKYFIWGLIKEVAMLDFNVDDFWWRLYLSLLSFIMWNNRQEWVYLFAFPILNHLAGGA